MVTWLRSLLKNLPTLLLALVLAVAVWISAVTAADPTQVQTYPRPVILEILGQDPGLVLMGEVPRQVTVKIKAPLSVLDRLSNNASLIHATLDLSGIGAGTHTQPVQVQLGIHPAEVNAVSPASVTFTLENLLTQTMPITLLRRGDPAVGYQLEEPALSRESVTISGPESLVKQVQEVRAIIDLDRVQQTIAQTVTLQPIDASENIVNGVTLNPDKILVTQPVTQRFGYRNVVVKVVLEGQIANGYRLTNLVVSPPLVTVFSADPDIVARLPGFVETVPLNLEGAKDDLDVRLELDLPAGVSVSGEQTVLVQVSIAAIESSITLNNMMVEVVGLGANLEATIAPDEISIILSGPLPLLDVLNPTQVRVVIDVSDLAPGTYQLVPEVLFASQEIRVESILPATIEVVIVPAGTPTATPTNTPTPTATPSP